MKFEDMNEIQRRLHNAACVLGADGDEYGFEKLQRDAIAEIERLRTAAENTVALLEHLTNTHLAASKHALCWRVLEQAREVLKA